MDPSCNDKITESNEELSQCAFICGYKILHREEIWKRVKNIVSVPSSEAQSPMSQPRASGDS